MKTIQMVAVKTEQLVVSDGEASQVIGIVQFMDLSVNSSFFDLFLTTFWPFLTFIIPMLTFENQNFDSFVSINQTWIQILTFKLKFW